PDAPMTAIFFVFILGSAAVSTATFVTVLRTDFHKTFGMRQRLEAEPGIQPVRVPCAEHEPPQALQLWMREHCGDEFFAETLSAFFLDDEDVGEPRERRKVRDDAREADLPAVQVNSKTKRIFHRAV